MALLFGALALSPPLAGLARHAEWAEALQYCLLALFVPALLVVGAPWALLGPSVAAALARGRSRHRERYRTAAWTIVGVAGLVVWRTPPVVDRLRTSGWLLAAEAVTLIATGTTLWLECLGSPPLAPRSARPLRIAVCAVTMWSVWVMAYLVAMSRANWYDTYSHGGPHGLSLAVDQQVTAGTLWAAATCCFVPVIFWNLVQWLRHEEDPDDELHRLVREERRRTLPPRPHNP